MKRWHGFLLLATSCQPGLGLVTRHAGTSDAEVPDTPCGDKKKPDKRIPCGKENRKGCVPMTDDGKTEQPSPSHGWLAPRGKKPEPEVKCVPQCPANTYCWANECVYRPWQYHNHIRKGCYHDMKWPGLTSYEESMCRTPQATSSQEYCESAGRFCKWSHDAPTWFRKILNRKDQIEAARWKWDQEMMKKDDSQNQAAKIFVKHVRPGDPILGTAIGMHADRS
jgi:hypothetical protein